MNFEFEEFCNTISENFSGSLPKKEIESLLEISGEYTHDTPRSTGKRLVVTKVKFTGKKSTGKPINFCSNINKGVNIWIADIAVSGCMVTKKN